jgi:hypothetical protein
MWALGLIARLQSLRALDEWLAAVRANNFYAIGHEILRGSRCHAAFILLLTHRLDLKTSALTMQDLCLVDEGNDGGTFGPAHSPRRGD